MKKIFCIILIIACIFVLGSCTLLGSSSTPSGTVSSGYPDSVAYKIKLSNEIYLCSTYQVSSTDAGISLVLKDVYSMSSDGKITWVGQQKDVPAVIIEKITK